MIFWLIFVSLAMILKNSTSLVAENESVSNEDEKEQFSAAPNNTPVTRVYVFGKPVYIRQPFMIPQRNVTFAAKNTQIDSEEDIREMLTRPNLFDKRRSRQSYPTRPTYVDEHIISAQTDGYVEKKPIYPLKQCFTEKSGFMCCNKQLLKVMEDTVDDMVAKKWKNCNIQQMSNALQKNCEKEFGTDFEALAGVGDFASKIHFFSDYVCKMEREGRVMLSYATPNRHNNNPGQYPLQKV